MAQHSAIIPTAGRPIAIRRAIESILSYQGGSDWGELIVVDNNVDNGLSADLASYCSQWTGRLRYVREPSPGLSSARHRGAAEARGELLTFIDDDVEISDTWLAAIQRAFEDPAVAMVGGPSIPKFTCSIPDWFWGYMTPTPYGGWMNSWLSLLDIGKDVEDINPNYIWGLNFSIRKKVLYDCGGFHPDLVPAKLQRWQGDGETGLTAKVMASGLRAVYRQDALLWHLCGPDRLTTEYFKKRAFFQGVCDSFTRIRAGADPTAAAKPSVSPPSPPPSASLYQRARQWAGRGIRSRFSTPSPQAKPCPWEASSSAVKQLTSRAYEEGWAFHQRAAAEDPALVAWARRKDFFDTDIRAEEAKSAAGPA